MADRKFIGLIFESEPVSLARSKSAYQSLASHPHQIFALLLEKEIYTEFFSRFESYGTQLAALLSAFPKYFGPKAEHQPHFKKDGFDLPLLHETLKSFIFSLISDDYPNVATQKPMADIVMAAIKLSEPGRSLELLGARLGEIPVILGRLIADGRIGEWSRSHPTAFRSIISIDTTLATWAETIAGLASHCEFHRNASQDLRGWEQMMDLVRSFRCDWCHVSSGPVTENREPRWRNPNSRKMNVNLRTFDSLLGDHLGPWKIILSAQALSSLKDSFHSGHSNDIRERLYALASGDWMRKSLRRRTSNDSRFPVPVYQVSCKGNFVILWQVDIAFDERHYHDFQVVKVWTICLYREITDMCEYIFQAQQTYTSSRIAACQTKDLETTKSTIFPKYINIDDYLGDFNQEKSPAAMVEELSPTVLDRKTIASSPALCKFYSLTTVVLDNIHPEASAAVFPVDVSGEEVHVINHFQTPAFILGRSGTGKTTCLIYKLASRYLSSEIIDEVPVRQLLLTRSKDLAQKLRVYTNRLINTRRGTGNMETRDVEDSTIIWNDTEEGTTQSLLSLGEGDFPLVCTFEYFLRLLENLIKVDDKTPRRKSALVKTLRPVDFTTFSIDYWSRFPILIRQRIPVDLAFIDIMGVIKGSASLDSDLRPLSREEYLARRWKLAPNFATDSERNSVYTLYEHYENIKRMRGEVDNTDRVINVLRELKKNPELQGTVGSFLDEIYVDEVQDQRPLEIELLLGLIRDPWGIHFAGDTAQCISKDSLFRFANAKALFYTRFSNLFSITNESFLVPALLPLSHNFRSHKGILSLASLVMELLYTGFPSLVDKLPPEIGELSGPQPTLYIGSNLVDVLQETKCSDERESDQEVTEFGEERVILVRDEGTQTALQRKIGDFALVLTILQSKGMEFEDVFLYDFFATSPCKSDLAILQDLLHERYSQDRQISEEPVRRVDWSKTHITLCSELKHLYVGITRARTRLWIVESEEHTISPVVDVWNSVAPRLLPKTYPEPLVEVVRENDFEASEIRKRFQSTNQTSPARWRELAYEFMTNKAYTQASFCFKKAKDGDGERLADAYLAELAGMEHRANGSKKKFISAFEEASELFRKAGKFAKAVECQEALGNTAAAGEIWSQSGSHQEAAWLFVKAGKPKMAAREYNEISKHEKALATYLHNALYNEMVIYLRDFSPKINNLCRNLYSRLAYQLLVKGKIQPKLQAVVINSLSSETEQETTFHEFRMMNHVFNLYLTQRRYKEAYDVAIDIGFLDEAFQLVNDHKLASQVSRPTLVEVFHYVQAAGLVTRKGHPENPKNGQKSYNHIIPALRGEKGLSPDQVWTAVATLKSDLSLGKNLSTTEFPDGRIRGFCDLLVTMITPDTGSIDPDLTKIPLDFINGAMAILQLIGTEKIIPPSAQLFLGIYEIPSSKGMQIALPWSPLCISGKVTFPLQGLEVHSVRESAHQHLLNITCSALGFLAQNSEKWWRNHRKNWIFQNRGLSGHEKLTSEQFSADLRSLLAFNLAFSKLKKILNSPPSRAATAEPVMALFHAREQLKSTTPDFQTLYGCVQDFIHGQVGLSIRGGEPSLSSLLHQMQVVTFFDIEERCLSIMGSLVDNREGSQCVVLEVVTIARDLRRGAREYDNPWHFCRNVHVLLRKLRIIRRATKQLRNYSSSVIGLYEEIITMLIVLTRPVYFVIPRSWADLHLPQWTKNARSTSAKHIFWYQSYMIKVVISFCELLRYIEARASIKLAESGTLVRRALVLLIISVINVGTSHHRHPGYGKMWTEVQKVFDYSNFNARKFRNLPAEKLLENLLKVFVCYDGKDKIGVVVTDGYPLPTQFSGLPLASNGIAVTYMNIRRPREQSLILAGPEINIPEIKAAYLITSFLKRTRAM